MKTGIFVCIIAILIGVVVVMYAKKPDLKCSSCESTEESYVLHCPQSYYDQGGWISGPPQIPQDGHYDIW